MKKIFTFAAATLLAAGAYAQTGVTKVDKTMVIYTTNDTITSEMSKVEDPETAEEVEQLAPKYWMGSSMVDGFNACGLPLTGTSSTQTQYIITTRQDYVDAATGFNMPAGSYRGVFIDGTIGLTGAVGTGNVNGYSNVKSMVLYFIPIPTAWKADGSISHQDYPTGRVQAKYVTVAEDGTVTAASNQSYREIHMNEVVDPLYDVTSRNIKSTKVDNFVRDENNPLLVTVDRPIKLVTNLQNKEDETELYKLFEANSESKWQKIGGYKKSEFANMMCEEGKYDYEFGLRFSATGTCSAEPENEAANDAASGYDCYNDKWGTKVDWSPETVVQLAVKKRMYLVGMAIVSATDGAASKFMNAADGLNASWKDSDVAYHGTAASAIQEVSASNKKVAPRKQLVNGQIVIGNYNIAGQRIK